MKLVQTLPMLGVLALGASLLPAAQAQITIPSRAILLPDTGTREINVAGSFFFDGEKPYALSGSYGYFTSPEVEFGGTAGIAGANHSKSLTTVGAFGNYYFRGGAGSENPLLPYVGIFAGYSHKEDSDGSLGAQAGVKYFFNPNVALSGEYQYRSTRHGNGTNQIVLGLSTFFR